MEKQNKAIETEKSKAVTNLVWSIEIVSSVKEIADSVKKLKDEILADKIRRTKQD